jgi:hypothetical protein
MRGIRDIPRLERVVAYAAPSKIVSTHVREPESRNLAIIGGNPWTEMKPAPPASAR